MQGKTLTLYVVMHNSTQEGEEPTFKLEEHVKFYLPYQSAGHIFRGLRMFINRMLPKEIRK